MNVAVTTTPLVILIQGGIAAGKSTITTILTQLGATHLDCDRMAHLELEVEEVKTALRNDFGDGIFDAEGRVDRQALGKVVFSDPAALARLEALIHPRVRTAVQAELERARTAAGEPRNVVVIDAAVAAKMRLTERYDLTVFVSANLETRRQRARERGWPEGELERREASQAPLSEKEQQADYTVPNDGDLSEAKSHVERFWNEFVEPRR